MSPLQALSYNLHNLGHIALLKLGRRYTYCADVQHRARKPQPLPTSYVTPTNCVPPKTAVLADAQLLRSVVARFTQRRQQAWGRIVCVAYRGNSRKSPPFRHRSCIPATEREDDASKGETNWNQGGKHTTHFSPPKNTPASEEYLTLKTGTKRTKRRYDTKVQFYIAQGQSCLCNTARSTLTRPRAAGGGGSATIFVRSRMHGRLLTKMYHSIIKI